MEAPEVGTYLKHTGDKFQSACRRHGEWKFGATEAGMQALHLTFQSACQRHGEWKLDQKIHRDQAILFQSACQRHGEWKMFTPHFLNTFHHKFQSACQRHGEWKGTGDISPNAGLVEFQSACQRHGEWKWVKDVLALPYFKFQSACQRHGEWKGVAQVHYGDLGLLGFNPLVSGMGNGRLMG